MIGDDFVCRESVHLGTMWRTGFINELYDGIQEFVKDKGINNEGH